MALLRDAAEAAQEGRIQQALDLGGQALNEARERRDADGQLLAHLQLTEWMLSLGRGLGARLHANASVGLLRAGLPQELRVRAWASQAYAASFVGDGASALQAGARARDEATEAADPRVRALALNYFGVASMWDCRWQTADEAFQASARHFPSSSRPILNAAFTQLLRGTVEATLEGARAAERTMQGKAFRAAFDRGIQIDLPPALGVIGADTKVVRIFLSGVIASWQHRHVEALECQEAVRETIDATPLLEWMRPYVHYLRGEHAFSLGANAEAVEHATRMIQASEIQGCEQTQWIGRLLRARCLSSVNDHAAASGDWRYLWMRAIRRHDEWGCPVEARPAFEAPPAEEPGEGWSVDFALTQAESEIVRQLLTGRRLQEIAWMRNTSYGTVRGQLAKVFEKTGYRSQAQLVAGLSRYRRKS